MLQQTQVDTVVPYFYRFLKQFPTVQALADSSLHDVMMIWENLGYYARARHIHESAKIISRDFAGKIPNTWDDLIRLPGIGPYTAGAVLSIAFGKPIPAIDGNARRVLIRLFAVKYPLDDPGTQHRIKRLAETLLPHHCPGVFNQALMELGALICTSKNAACSSCPVGTLCRAFAHKLQHCLPIKGKKSPLPHKHAVAAVMRDSQGRVFVVRRPSGGLLGDLWTFPGGFLHDGESMSEALQRTVDEELIDVGAFIGSVKHAYTHFRVTLHLFYCHIPPNKELRAVYPNCQWIFSNHFKKFPFSKLDRKAITAILHDQEHSCR